MKERPQSAPCSDFFIFSPFTFNPRIYVMPTWLRRGIGHWGWHRVVAKETRWAEGSTSLCLFSFSFLFFFFFFFLHRKVRGFLGLAQHEVLVRSRRHCRQLRYIEEEEETKRDIELKQMRSPTAKRSFRCLSIRHTKAQQDLSHSRT